MSWIIATCLLAQDRDLLRAKIEGAAGEVYSLEGSSIHDLEIRVFGVWGGLDLGDLNRRVYWFNAGADRRAGWSGGTASRPLSDEEKRARSELDRTVWAFLSNAADDQAVERLAAEEPRPEVATDGALTRVSWPRPGTQAEQACWFDADGRLVRAGGEMLTFENGNVTARAPWTDAYVYADVAGRRCLTTLTTAAGELRGEWEEVDGELMLKSIAGTLEGGVRVEVDLSARTIGKGAAKAAYEESGR